jgi:hypothetical protein
MAEDMEEEDMVPMGVLVMDTLVLTATDTAEDLGCLSWAASLEVHSWEDCFSSRLSSPNDVTNGSPRLIP